MNMSICLVNNQLVDWYSLFNDVASISLRLESGVRTPYVEQGQWQSLIWSAVSSHKPCLQRLTGIITDAFSYRTNKITCGSDASVISSCFYELTIRNKCSAFDELKDMVKVAQPPHVGVCRPGSKGNSREMVVSYVPILLTTDSSVGLNHDVAHWSATLFRHFEPWLYYVS